MSRRTPPQVNASLIREGRMIFQQLQQIFGDRTKSQRPTSYNDVLIAEAQAKAAKAPTQTFKCVRCLGSKRSNPLIVPKDAVTLFNGNAVCEEHI